MSVGRRLVEDRGVSNQVPRRVVCTRERRGRTEALSGVARRYNCPDEEEGTLLPEELSFVTKGTTTDDRDVLRTGRSWTLTLKLNLYHRNVYTSPNSTQV